VSNRKKVELLQDLRAKGFKSHQEIFSKEAASGDAKDADKAGGFDYLVGMAIWSLTMERVEKLKQESKDKTEELETLQKLTIHDLWERDLDAILAELKSIDDYEEELRVEEEAMKKSGKSGKNKASTGRRPRRRGEVAAAGKKEEDDDDDEPSTPAPPVKRRKENELPKDENSNDFLARMKERQKARSKLEMPSSKKPRVA